MTVDDCLNRLKSWQHASDATALFAAPTRPGDKDEDIEDDIFGGGGGDELDVDASGWDSGGGSPVEEGDQDAILVSNFFSNEGSESD